MGYNYGGLDCFIEFTYYPNDNKEPMSNWKTTLGGLISGLAAIFGGAEAVRQGQIEIGSSAIISGIALIYKGYQSADK